MVDHFRSEGYINHNRIRQKHLVSLGLDLDNKKVLELGAGIGDLTNLFLDRHCTVTSIEGRTENAVRIRKTHPEVRVIEYDLDSGLPHCGVYDVVYAYGILYHLQHPGDALRIWAGVCSGLLLLESCVTPGIDLEVNWCEENSMDVRGSISGVGCRPTRTWIHNELKKYFTYVYMPITQPDHEEFPLDWNNITTEGLTRAVFVASRAELNNPLLTTKLPVKQTIQSTTPG